ncbi:hypothetical protein ACFLZ8_03695 [Planctomycetota bacterium]
METQENIETKSDINQSITRDWNGWDLFFSAVILIFIISVPSGWIEYLDGRFDNHLFFFDACFIYPTMIILIIALSYFSVLQLFVYWKRYTRRKKLTKFFHIGSSIVFIASFIIPLFTPFNIYLGVPGYKPFTDGFRDRIRSEADIQDIRNWLKTLNKEDCTGELVSLFDNGEQPFERHWPDKVKWPESLTVFEPGYVCLSTDENGNPKVRLTWGGPFGHWGFEIGTVDMAIPPSDFSQWGEYRLPMEPGAYVWHELQ